jgi:hypothetical protein
MAVSVQMALIVHGPETAPQQQPLQITRQWREFERLSSACESERQPTCGALTQYNQKETNTEGFAVHFDAHGDVAGSGL